MLYSIPCCHTTTGIMLAIAAIISLLLVLILVTLLHCYAKWFLARDLHRHGRSSSSVLFVPTSYWHNLHSLLTISSINEDNLSTSIKGLEPSAISSIPQFVYRANETRANEGLECVICLSLFENEENGRKLGVCQHVFHVDRIDMWLRSNVTCPICRAPAVKVSGYGHDVVVDYPSSENQGTDMYEQYYGEFTGETRTIGEDDPSSRLEIVVSNTICEFGI